MSAESAGLGHVLVLLALKYDPPIAPGLWQFAGACCLVVLARCTLAADACLGCVRKAVVGVKMKRCTEIRLASARVVSKLTAFYHHASSLRRNAQLNKRQ